MAAAPSCPGYQAATTAFTLSSQGMATGLPVSSTTMVLGLAAATAAMIASCPPGSDRRSEEHTYELKLLMRRSYAVFCLKKKLRSLIMFQNYITLNNSILFSVT